jgi:DNA-binding NtrC family response regulator
MGASGKRVYVLHDEPVEASPPPPVDFLALLRAVDPEFVVPRSNHALKQAKLRLRKRLNTAVERLFLEKLLESSDTITEVARRVKINRTFLYRLLKRHLLTGL